MITERFAGIPNMGDCWIVTGSIFASEVRLFRTVDQAWAYAKEMDSKLKAFRLNIVIEPRWEKDMQGILEVIEESRSTAYNRSRK